MGEGEGILKEVHDRITDDTQALQKLWEIKGNGFTVRIAVIWRRGASNVWFVALAMERRNAHALEYVACWIVKNKLD